MEKKCSYLYKFIFLLLLSPVMMGGACSDEKPPQNCYAAEEKITRAVQAFSASKTQVHCEAVVAAYDEAIAMDCDVASYITQRREFKKNNCP